MSFTFNMPDRTRSQTRERVSSRNDRRQASKRADTKDANDIYPIPDIVNKERRESAKLNFKLFCELYFPNRFALRWSRVHLELLETMQASVLTNGGQICYAFPRGMGKTSIAEVLAIWALVYGHMRFVVLIASKADLAHELLKSIVQELESNDSLTEDFPEICYPIQQLERMYIRAKGQHVNGRPTFIEYGNGSLVFPTIEGSPISGSRINCFGLTGSFRGQKHTLPTGEIIRPDLVIIDDPQTDKSAKSESTTAMRERLIDGAILGLAGPKRSITAVMPCTVIRPNDLAERFLDKEKRPEWQGQRTKMLLKFPSNMELWNEYNDLRKTSLRSGQGIKLATEFYKNNRVLMDEGAEVAWSERFDEKTELSGIQSAMNLFFRNPLTFASEYQNDPLIESNTDDIITSLNKDIILKRVIGLPKGIIPDSTLYITTGVDVQKSILFYLTVAWGPDFSGVICDYGTYPRQHSFDGWVASNPTIPLGFERPNLAIGPKVYSGLLALRDEIFTQPFKRENSEETLYASRFLIDAGWAESSDAVFNFCRDSNRGSTDTFLPSFGRGVTATMVPFNEWQLKQGEIRKWNCRILPRTMKSTQGRNASFDGNQWKTLITERLLVPMGVSTGLHLFGADPGFHETLATHLTSEEAVERSGRGRKIKEWAQKDKHNENHWWDCLIMSAVAANLAGLEPHAKTQTIGDLTYSIPSAKKERKVLDTSRLPKVEV